MSQNNFHRRPTIPPAFSDGKHTHEPPIKIPSQIGPYKIESLLNKGGMSLLYLGTHPDSKEPITIKVLSPRFVSHPEITRRFLKEAEIIAMADHPNIIKLFGYGEWEGGLYIAMEFIEGMSLRQYLLQSSLTLKRALEITLEIAYALCHLHTHGVIHRDLKPENILLTDEGRVKVIDFGIAQLIDKQEEDGVSQQGRLIGTPVYMSPEQRKDPASVSYPSDIYSLGIITYELVLGKLSHGQLHLSLMPKGLQKILSKTLQPEIVNRYQDIVDFISDLTAYLYSAELQKEKKAGDRTHEFYEKIKDMQSRFIFSPIPVFPNLKIGLALHQPQDLSSIYYDFFQFSESSFAVLFAEPSIQEGEGIIISAMLKGLLKGGISNAKDPVEFIKSLNFTLNEIQKKLLVPLCYLIFDLKENQLSYLSCSYGNLWLFNKDKGELQLIESSFPPLGSTPAFSPNFTSFTYQTGDQLILTTLKFGEELFPEAYFKKLLYEQTFQVPQKQAEHLLRKAKSAYPNYFEAHAALICCLSPSQ